MMQLYQSSLNDADSPTEQGKHSDSLWGDRFVVHIKVNQFSMSISICALGRFSAGFSDIIHFV